MTSRSRLAVLAVWLSTVGLSAVLVVGTAAVITVGEEGEDFTLAFMIMLSTIALSFSSVSAIVSLRRPGNRMGWLLAPTELRVWLRGSRG